MANPSNGPGSILNESAVLARDSARHDEAESLASIHREGRGGEVDASPKPESIAVRLLQEGRPTEACAIMDAAIEQSQSAQLWNDWATVQHGAGDSQKAEQGYRRALELSCRYREAAVNLGILLLSQGHSQEAAAYLNCHSLTSGEREITEELTRKFDQRERVTDVGIWKVPRTPSVIENAMRDPSISVRSVEVSGGYFRILTAVETLRDVVDGTGTNRWGPGEGWSFKSCIDLAGQCYLLPLRDSNGDMAVAVLDKNLKVLSELRTFRESQDPEVFQYLSLAADTLFAYLEARLIPDNDGPLFETFSSMGTATLAGLSKLISFRTSRLAICELPGALVFRYGDRSSEILASAVTHCLQSRNWLLKNAAAKGRIDIPAICQEGMVDKALLVSHMDEHPVYFCIENTSGLTFYILFRMKEPAILYLPAFRAAISDPAPSEGEAAYLLGHIRTSLCAFMELRLLKMGTPYKGLSLMTFGYQHFGHAIWEEMHALDTLLMALPEGETLRTLYFVPANSGIESFGRVEDLYPELQGTVIRASSEFAIYAHAIAVGTGLLVRNGRKTLQVSRDRIRQYIERRFAGTDLKALVRETCQAHGKMRLVVTLGLRLTNRVPEDLLGFYVAVAKALSQRFGPLLIVVDGIAGSADPMKPAVGIHNATRKWEEGCHGAYRDGAAELTEEQEWCCGFMSAIRELNLDIAIVNCVGSPIQQNLLWMQQSAFFVAPFGTGLAKLRWALDIPGFVLTSRINLEYHDLLHVWDDEEFTEPPYTPLYFTAVDDVEDLPVVPPRPTTLVLDTRFPHPDDFRMKQGQVIEKILNLITLYSHEGVN